MKQLYFESRFLHRFLLRSGGGLLSYAVLAATVCAVTVQAYGQHPKRNDQYKHQVEQLEQVWRTAELTGDAVTMDKLLSDDYVGITMTGQVVTKMQQLDRLSHMSMVLSRLDLTDVHVKLIGTTAIVTSLAVIEGTYDGAPIRGTYRYTRVYSRQPSGAWKVTNFEATRVGPPPLAPPPVRGRGNGRGAAPPGNARPGGSGTNPGGG